MKDFNRAVMFYAFLGFLLVWYAGVIIAIERMGVSAYEALGLGTASGVFLKQFGDMGQFLWRKAPPK